MIAQKYGQDPKSVAHWDPEWLIAASTAMEAESAAQAELQRRQNRANKARRVGR